MLFALAFELVLPPPKGRTHFRMLILPGTQFPGILGSAHLAKCLVECWFCSVSHPKWSLRRLQPGRLAFYACSLTSMVGRAPRVTCSDSRAGEWQNPFHFAAAAHSTGAVDFRWSSPLISTGFSTLVTTHHQVAIEGLFAVMWWRRSKGTTILNWRVTWCNVMEMLEED
jgi:hypothetical protein